MTIEILSGENSSDDLSDTEIENSRISLEIKLNLMKALEEYVFEIPEIFNINLINNIYHKKKGKRC